MLIETLRRCSPARAKPFQALELDLDALWRSRVAARESESVRPRARTVRAPAWLSHGSFPVSHFPLTYSRACAAVQHSHHVFSPASVVPLNPAEHLERAPPRACQDESCRLARRNQAPLRIARRASRRRS